MNSLKVLKKAVSYQCFCTERKKAMRKLILLVVILGTAFSAKADMVLHWDFEGTSSTVVDRVGTLNGKIEGGCKRDTVSGLGAIVTFDGTGRVDAQAWTGAPMDGGNFTISTICRADTIKGICTQTVVGWDGMLLGCSWGKAYSMWITGVGYNESFWLYGDSWMDTRWHHLAMTYEHGAKPSDPHKRTLFVDGVPIPSNNAGISVDKNPDVPGLIPQLLNPANKVGFGHYERYFSVGDFADGSTVPKDWPFKGDVADVKVWDTALTAEEMLAEYEHFRSKLEQANKGSLFRKLRARDEARKQKEAKNKPDPERNMVVTYSGPNGIAPSDQYAVKLEQNGKQYDSFVYLCKAQWRTNRSKNNSWTTFSFSGPVTVSVTKLKVETVKTCKVLPSSYGVKPRIKGNCVTFELDRPRKVSVEFDGDLEHPMLVFADALEIDVPNANDPNVIYFGPGLHEIGDTTIASGKTIYLAGGAYVKGRLKGYNVQDVTIRGRGVLSGEEYPHGSNYSHNLINIQGGQTTRVLLEGITLTNSPLYLTLIEGANNTIRNVKMMGWYFGTDGAYVESDGLIEDCFVKVNDDAFKLYVSNTVVRDCVIWQLENGAPFQISWNMPTDNSGFLVQNVDIIRMEHRTEQINLAAFDAIHGGKGHMSDYLFEDIRIENADWRLFYLTLAKHEFAPRDGEMGQISNLTFRNITATGSLPRPNVIKGWDAEHRVFNVTFENLKINGKYIRNAEEGNFEIDPKTTGNIVFKVDEANSTESDHDY
jgi:hypothetical protein